MPTPTTPIRRLLLLFLLWKSLLLTLALLTPSPAYDTSTTLILPALPDSASQTHRLLHRLAEKLTRWDAIYFVTTATRGYLYEQEWAFGHAYTLAIRYLTPHLRISLPAPIPQALAGILISNLAHLASVLVLHHLTQRVYQTHARRDALAFVAAALHVLSPAGVFLCAPYAESLCALLSFVGVLVWVKSEEAFAKGKLWRGADGTVLAGVWFGFSSAVRSNGVLNGALFLHDFVLEGLKIFRTRTLKWEGIVKIAALGAGGVATGMGIVVPQVYGWREFCTGEERRPWCEDTVPSIYGFVQKHYWDVGFLRYWKVSNIPLFLLAAPMLVVLTKSGVWGIAKSGVVKKLAIAQILLAVMALLSYHVQIITRISSGCVVWYWWLAQEILDAGVAETAKAKKDGAAPKARNWGLPVVRFMVVYALIQTVLFAGFLPPA